MDIRVKQGYKFVAGTAETGRIVLRRADGSTAELPGLVIVRGVSLVDNNDSTFTVVFDGS
jgi:hypothetical protein